MKPLGELRQFLADHHRQLGRGACEKMPRCAGRSRRHGGVTTLRNCL